MSTLNALKSRPVVAFVILTCLITWSFWSLPLLEQAGLITEAPPWWGLGSFGPSIAGLVMAGFTGGWPRLKALLKATVKVAVHPGWYLAAFAIPAVVALPALSFHWYTGGTLDWSAIPSPGLVALLFVQIFLLGGPLNEELGWRGFMLPALQERISPLVASLIIGAVWAGWHIPLFVAGTEGYTQIPFHLYLVNVMALSLLFTWVFNGTGQSVFMAILFHATFNTTNWLLLAVLGEDAGMAVGIYVATMILVGLVTIARVRSAAGKTR